MKDRKCKTCGEVKPITQFERHTSGWRHVCNTCQDMERDELRRILARHMRPKAINGNDVSQWYAPVDRSRPMIWSVGTSTPTNNNEESHQ